jgi:3-dehydrotetronate 4-kinase
VTFFGAIADDFTGATDLASLLSRSGIDVSLRLGVPETAPSQTSQVEIIALKCRTAQVEEALSETRAALQWLRQAGAQRFFWKYCSTFDSTARGNIGPVAENLMSELGVDQTTYCPAFPENGRAVFMGNLFVGELPLAESPMKDHPLTPMRDSNLVRLLAPQVTKPVGLANRLTVEKGSKALRARLAELRAQGIAHVVVDAVSNSDLYVIAEACHDMPLLTGGSAVAMPLPEIWMKQDLLRKKTGSAKPTAPRGRSIILSGSCSAMTNKQVEAHLAQGQPSFRLDPFELDKQGAEAAIHWLSTVPSLSVPLIYSTAKPEELKNAQAKLGTEHASILVEKALAACAVAARDWGARRFIVAGGETSGAVAKALGVTRLDIGPEIAPGVPWCFSSSAGMEIALTLKSGNFGRPTFFQDALELLGP